MGTGASRDTARSIGSAIDKRRTKAGISISQLAAAAEVDDRQMKRVIAGKSGLSIYSLGRVAAALGCHPADILRDAIPQRPIRRATPRRSLADPPQRSE